VFINLDYKPNYKLIGFNELTESHTALYLYDKLLELIKPYSFNIANIISITRDNAFNNNTFIQTIYNKNPTLKIYNIHYTAHIINLIVKDTLKEYLLRSAAEEELSNYISTLTLITNTSSYTKIKGLTNKIRRIATIIKYT